MKIRYDGPHAEVEIAATGQTCKRGGTVDVDPAVAKELLQQAYWKKTSTRKKKES